MRSPCRHDRQRGAAVLAVTVMLCFVAFLTIALVNRHVVAETNATATLVRSSEAAEAAEAGLEWTLAMLNDGTLRGGDCLPSIGAAALTFAERSLRLDATTATIAPAVWNDAGTPRNLEAACRLGTSGWSCACPRNGAAGLLADAADPGAPAFEASFAAVAQPGLVRVAAIGCHRTDGLCAGVDANGFEPVQRSEALLVLRPALRAAPAAAITVRGSVVSGATFGVANPSPARGSLALHAGGAVVADHVRVTGAAGSSSADSVAGNDASLAGLDADRFFARYFGSSQARWSAQPAARHVSCAEGCGAAIAAAVALGAQIIVVDGAARLDGPLALGSVARPVALVVSGALRVGGTVAITGVVAAGDVEWRGTGGGVDGALVVAGNYSGSGTPDFVRDDAVLLALARRVGSYVRVNGGWKDF